jgi:hypothetical protein
MITATEVNQRKLVLIFREMKALLCIPVAGLVAGGRASRARRPLKAFYLHKTQDIDELK